MSDNMIIRNGRVIDPAQNLDKIADVLISHGKIAEIVPHDAAERASMPGLQNARVIDATNKIVCPGLIDMHVHLREPGNEDAETIASGAAAAVAGGFTSIACMPNTKPALDTEAMIEFVYRQAARAGLCNVYPIGAITKGREGRELAEMGQMVRAGAVAFSDDGVGVANSGVMFRALQYAGMLGKPLIQHCEDADLAAGGCINNGRTSLRMGLPGIPPMAEEIMIQRDLLLAENTKSHYHVAHISTAGSVQLVREAKARGIKVTAEVCPHHLLLTDECTESYDTNFKMNPPLRSQKDIDACIQGVMDGTIDCLVTDHAPHGREGKELDFQSAPFGIVGLEVALGLLAKALISPGHLDWPDLIAKLTINPARIMDIPKGTLRSGSGADVTIIDPEDSWIVDIRQFKSRSRNCPYDGWPLPARATHTIVNGDSKFMIDSNIAIGGSAERV